MQREVVVFLAKVAWGISEPYYVIAGIFCVSWRVKHSMGEVKQGFWMIGDVSVEFQFWLDRKSGLLDMFGMGLEDLDSSAQTFLLSLIVGSTQIRPEVWLGLTELSTGSTGSSTHKDEIVTFKPQWHIWIYEYKNI